MRNIPGSPGATSLSAERLMVSTVTIMLRVSAVRVSHVEWGGWVQASKHIPAIGLLQLPVRWVAGDWLWSRSSTTRRWPVADLGEESRLLFPSRSKPISAHELCPIVRCAPFPLPLRNTHERIVRYCKSPPYCNVSQQPNAKENILGRPSSPSSNPPPFPLNSHCSPAPEDSP
jgi:hypothetical protein